MLIVFAANKSEIEWNLFRALNYAQRSLIFESIFAHTTFVVTIESFLVDILIS